MIHLLFVGLGVAALSTKDAPRSQEIIGSVLLGVGLSRALNILANQQTEAMLPR